MKATITIELDGVTKSVLDQMQRSGFEVVKEGGGLSLRVPNRPIPRASVRVNFEEAKKPTKSD